MDRLNQKQWTQILQTLKPPIKQTNLNHNLIHLWQNNNHHNSSNKNTITYATTCDTISPQAEIQNFKQCKKIQPRLQNLFLSQEICRSRYEKINKNDKWMGYPTYLLLRLKASLPAKSTGREMKFPQSSPAYKNITQN